MEIRKRCCVETTNHDKCPARLACMADPCAIMPEHQKTVTKSQCPNKVMPKSRYCREHQRFEKMFKD